MARDNPAIGSSRYVTVKSGQGWLEVAQKAVGNQSTEAVSKYAAALAKKHKRPRAGMVVQAPSVYQGVIGQTPAPSPYFGGMRPPDPTANMAAITLPPQQVRPQQVQMPSWAQNYQNRAQQRATGMPALPPTTALPDTQIQAQQRGWNIPAPTPAMPAGFYPTPTQLPDTWAQGYPRTAQAIGAQIESGYYPATISALDAYTLQLPDEILSAAGYEKQPWGGWARMGPARAPVAPASSRYGYGGYGGRGGRGGGGRSGTGTAPRPASGGYGGYGGGYSTSGRMLEGVGAGLISWRI